jgi:hypothetical protein
MSRNIEFRPTLVIGLGGTGQGVLLKLKKRFTDQFGEVPPIIQFLAIDTAQEAQRQDTSSDGKTNVELKPKDEQFIISVTDANNLLLGKNPHINEWWPPGTRVSIIKSGAQQRRALGRLALFAYYDKIKRRITDKLDEVRKIENKNLMQKKGHLVSERNSVEVYVVTSLAGGTGSGMFIDIAFITRNIARSSSITGVFVLSKVFAKLAATDFVKTNTYAALKEIEYLSRLTENERLEVNYGINKIEVHQPPYDMIYLTDSINEADTVIDKKTLYSQIADGIYLLAGSEIGASNSARFNNINSIKERTGSAALVENRSTDYCSFGVASCTWKVNEFKSKFQNAKNASTRKLIEDLLGSSANDENVKANTATLAQQCNLGEERIDDLLKEVGAQIGNKGPETLTDKRERMGHDSQALGHLLAEHQNYLSEVEDYARENARVNCERLKTRFLNNLSDFKKKGLSRSDFLSSLSSSAQQLGQVIDNTKKELERLRQIADRQAKAIKIGETSQSSGEAEKKAGGVLAWIRQFFSRESVKIVAAADLANKADRKRQLTAKAIHCDRAILLLNELQAEVESMATMCRDFRAGLDEALARLKSQEENPEEGEPLEENPFIMVLPYQPDVKKKEVSLFRFAEWREQKHLSMSDLMRGSSDEVAKVIGEYIDEVYKDEREMTISEVLRQEQDKKAIMENQDKLNYLSQQAAPLWSYTGTDVPLAQNQVTNLAYCGVPDSELSPVKNLKGGWPEGAEPELISTIDPHRITFFNITAGVPLFALSDLKEMKEEYNKKRRPACHIDRRWQNLPDLFPARIDDPLACFAVARAKGFEVIKKNGKGTYTIYLPGAPQKLLAKGLEPSFDKFQEKAEVVEAVRLAIASKLDAHDRLDTKKNLDTHKKYLDNLIANNGLSPSSIEFMQKEVKALDDYLRDF